MTDNGHYTLTGDQQDALDTILDWYSYGGNPPLTLGGYAGTGKSTLLGLLPRNLPGKRIHFASYTGKAVSVLQSKLPPSSNVSTLHRLLYHPKQVATCTASGEPLDRFRLRCAEHAKADDQCAFAQ